MWQNILGHDDVKNCFAEAIRKGRLASTFLFVGPDGIGKRKFALALAQTLQCERVAPEHMAPCGVCSCCRQVLDRTHPDVLHVRKPEDKAFLPVDLLVGPKENRGGAGLCYELAKAPYYQRRKIAILDDADMFNAEGANAMLKTLEEPPPGAMLILLGTSASRQLPTIRSRCQILRFSPLSKEDVARILRDRLAADPGQCTFREDMIPNLALYANGSVSGALALADVRLWDFRREFLDALALGPTDRIALARRINENVDEVGKSPPLRRTRLRVIMEMAADYYRRLAMYLSGARDPDRTIRAEWEPILHKAARRWHFDADAAAAVAVKTLDRVELLNRNVHMVTLLEAWLDDLQRVGEGDPAPLALAPWSLNVV